MQTVFVSIATPNNGNKPFVYGVFTTYDAAVGFAETWGCKDCTYRVTEEPVIVGP